MVKLKSSKRTKPKEDFEITKKGRVKKDRRLITPAYERKYSHKIVQNYTVDKNERLHNKRGRFVSSQVKSKYDSLIERSRKRTKKKLDKKEVTTTRKEIPSKFLSSSYAFTYECTCYIQEGITTHEDDKYGRTLTHYYTISSNHYLTSEQAKSKHDRHYPTHDLIHIEHTSTKVIGFD